MLRFLHAQSVSEIKKNRHLAHRVTLTWAFEGGVCVYALTVQKYHVLAQSSQ